MLIDCQECGLTKEAVPRCPACYDCVHDFWLVYQVARTDDLRAKTVREPKLPKEPTRRRRNRRGQE